MDFDLDQDLAIFTDFFKKRPEISAEGLKHDLQRYYLPYAQKLIQLKQKKPGLDGLIVGVSAIQGAGKTTQGEILEILLSHFGHSTDSLSIDDHYLTHKQLCELRQKDPRFIRRGVTHDIPLAIRDLKKLKTMADGKPILISGYDKGVQSGDGDRLRWINLTPKLTVQLKVVEEELIVNKQKQTVKALQIISANYELENLILLDDMGSDLPILEHFLPDDLCQFLEIDNNQVFTVKLFDHQHACFSGRGEIHIPLKDLPNGWRVVTKKPNFIFYDGWMLGARRVEDEAIFSSGLPALDSESDQQFAKDVNKKLTTYETLWQMFDFLNCLYVLNYQDSLKWRDQAEEVLRQKGEGMSKEQIIEFVHYFWRSVHPAIHIKNLAHDTSHTNQVVTINDDHSIGEILTPNLAQTKYP